MKKKEPNPYYDHFVLRDGTEIQLVLVGQAPHVDELRNYVLASDGKTFYRVRDILRNHFKPRLRNHSKRRNAG